MNLEKKKKLAARTLNVGKERIIFLKSRLEEIKEAITRQDIKDLHKDGAIIIKEEKGRKKKKKRKKKKGIGSIKRKVKKRKREYVVLVRKLRKYIRELKKQGKLTKEDALELRKKIRNREFRDVGHLKEYIKSLK